MQITIDTNNFSERDKKIVAVLVGMIEGGEESKGSRPAPKKAADPTPKKKAAKKKDPEPEPEEETITADDCKAALAEVVEEAGGKKAKALLKKFKAKKLSEIDEDDRADFVQACREAVE